MKNWKVIFAIFAIVFLIMLKEWGSSVEAKDEADLLKVLSVLKDEKITITEWSLYAREKAVFQSMEEVKEYAVSLQRKFPDWRWAVHEDSGQWELVGTNATEEYREYIKAAAAFTKNAPQTYIIYELKGSDFHKESEQFIREKWNATAFDIFREDATIFSCVKGEFSDKIKATLPESMSHLLTLFQAKSIDTAEEKRFISTTAYSPIFAESINSDEDKMNLQIGIRAEGLGAKTTLVVGTPIITIEY